VTLGNLEDYCGLIELRQSQCTAPDALGNFCLLALFFAKEKENPVLPRVQISKISSPILIYREVTGPYSQHPVGFEQWRKWKTEGYLFNLI